MIVFSLTNSVRTVPPSATVIVAPEAVNGPIVIGEDGTTKARPNDGIGVGTGTSRPMVPEESDPGLAPRTSTVSRRQSPDGGCRGRLAGDLCLGFGHKRRGANRHVGRACHCTDAGDHVVGRPVDGLRDWTRRIAEIVGDLVKAEAFEHGRICAWTKHLDLVAKVDPGHPAARVVGVEGLFLKWRQAVQGRVAAIGCRQMGCGLDLRRVESQVAARVAGPVKAPTLDVRCPRRWKTIR